MRKLSWLLGLLVWSCVWGQDALPPATLSLRVVNPAGQPIAGATVGALLTDLRRLIVAPASAPFWQTTDAQGKCVLQWDTEQARAVQEVLYGERRGMVSVLISASGYQACLLQLSYPATLERTVTLKPARPLEIELYAATPPPADFGTRPPLRSEAPLMNLYNAALGELTLYAPIPQQISDGELPGSARGQSIGLCVGFGIERLTANRYRAWLPPDAQPPFALVIQRPDWLQGYIGEIGADALQQRRAVFYLPSGANLIVRVDASQFPSGGEADSYRALRLIRRNASDALSYYVLHSELFNASQHQLRFENLAPSADWQIELNLRSGRSRYSPQQRVRLLRQETRTVSLRYVPFNPSRYKGERTLTLRVLQRDGKPATQRTVRVSLYLPEYANSIEIAKGKLDAQGRLTLRNLYELPTPPDDPDDAPRYFVSFEGEWEELGYFTLVQGDGKQEVVIREPLQVGDPAPDIEMIDLRTNAKRRLSEFLGRYVLLDFWATWCMPCHRALAELKERLERVRAAWGDRLSIVLVSIDDQQSGVLGFLQQRGWDALGEPMWAGAGGWSAAAAQAFRVNSIPRQILIDPDGKIRFLDLELPLDTVPELLQESGTDM
ncbi:MAG: thioredoxin-like domain-containing protein [Fimbriimonadales bacterium]|nr:thioredoxin-like domain-containing protein [Fimbriimonadales bacterium]